MREELCVHRDGLADGWVTDNWPQLVEELFPLAISQLFFFDAEKIRTLAEDESSSKALEAAIKSLLGLDIVERLIADSSVLQGRLAQRVGSEEERAQAAGLERRIGELRIEEQRLRTERASLENLRQRAVEEQRLAEEQFSGAGGRHWEERQQRSQRMQELKSQISDREAELCGLAAGELPLAMIGGLLAAVAVQDGCERQASVDEAIGHLVEERDARLMALLRESKATARVVERVAAQLEADRAQRRPTELVPRRLELTETSRLLLGDLRGRTLASLAERSAGLCSRLDALRREREDLERVDAATPKKSEIARFLDQVREAIRKATLLTDQSARLDENYAPVKAELEQAEERMKSLVQQRVQGQAEVEDSGRMLKLAERTGATMREFLARVTSRKIDRLSTLVTESFQYLLRKSSFVQRIAIDRRRLPLRCWTGTVGAFPRAGCRKARSRSSRYRCCGAWPALPPDRCRP